MLDSLDSHHKEWFRPAGEQEVSTDIPIRCLACGLAVTRTEASTTIDGAYALEKINPVGYVFQLRFFVAAAGCAITGEPQSEHSWFRPYSWQIALCRGCGEHLGWYFAGAAAAPFFALIANQLIERDCL
ncbi:MAG: cereblon family protein [Gammaproteobacteria bacterium]